MCELVIMSANNRCYMNYQVFLEWVAMITPSVICFIFLHNQIFRLEQKMDQQGARTDRLYEMFVDLLKERK